MAESSGCDAAERSPRACAECGRERGTWAAMCEGTDAACEVAPPADGTSLRRPAVQPLPESCACRCCATAGSFGWNLASICARMR